MYPLNYIEPVFRPPSEWKSLILQVTNGCSWNRCSYCEMYTEEQKKFNHKPIEQITKDLNSIKHSQVAVERIFLADGDALTLSTRRLKSILESINTSFPLIKRVSSYCLPRNLKNKSVDDLKELKSLGLDLLYVGCETGDDDLLTYINKGENYTSSLDALRKIKSAGIRSSVMILNGLGGANYTQQHASNSARLMNATQPEYLSSLVISFPRGHQRFTHGFERNEAEFIELDQAGLFSEMQQFISQLQLQCTLFRSDHASNYLVLKGVLGRDKERLLASIDQAIHQPKASGLRQNYQRSL